MTVVVHSAAVLTAQHGMLRTLRRYFAHRCKGLRSPLAVTAANANNMQYHLQNEGLHATAYLSAALKRATISLIKQLPALSISTMSKRAHPQMPAMIHFYLSIPVGSLLRVEA